MVGHGTSVLPSIHIKGKELEPAGLFQYSGSTVTDNLSLDVELNKRIGKTYQASVGEQAIDYIYQDRHPL